MLVLLKLFGKEAPFLMHRSEFSWPKMGYFVIRRIKKPFFPDAIESVRKLQVSLKLNVLQ